MKLSRIQLRFKQVRALPAYAIVTYVDDDLSDVCFHGARAAQQIHSFDRDMQAILNLSNMDSFEREQILMPVLEFCEHVKQVRLDLSAIIAARLLNTKPENGFQQIWDTCPDKNVWEHRVLCDYELPVTIDVPRSDLANMGLQFQPSPPRIRVRLPSRAEGFQRLAQELRHRAARAPSPETSILGFDRTKPGGHRQEPEPMSREEWKYLLQTGVMAGERDWDDEVRRVRAAKLDDPL